MTPYFFQPSTVFQVPPSGTHIIVALNRALFLEEFLEVLSFILVINLSLFAEHTGIIDVAVLLPKAEEVGQ